MSQSTAAAGSTALLLPARPAAPPLLLRNLLRKISAGWRGVTGIVSGKLAEASLPQVLKETRGRGSEGRG